MKIIFLATTLALIATPAMSEQVELMCNGQYKNYKDGSSASQNGIKVVLDEGEGLVSIRGGYYYFNGDYEISDIELVRESPDVVFVSSFTNDDGKMLGRLGTLNRYTGELGVFACGDVECVDYYADQSATCVKAAPLF